MLQLRAKERWKKPNERGEKAQETAAKQSDGRRRRKSVQLYRQYVGKSNIFGETRGPQQQSGRWPDKAADFGERGAAIRMSDSSPTPAQLEWQRQRRARAMSASGASTTSGFSSGSGGIVQRHAEMRSYLQHCQRVLNARARVDSSVPATKRGPTRQCSAMTPPFAVNTLETRRMSNDGSKEQMGRSRRTKSVPTTGKNDRIKEDNERLLNRLLQIGLRSPPKYALSSASKRRSKGDK